jgi:predicted P-loop ATPase
MNLAQNPLTEQTQKALRVKARNALKATSRTSGEIAHDHHRYQVHMSAVSMDLSEGDRLIAKFALAAFADLEAIWDQVHPPESRPDEPSPSPSPPALPSPPPAPPPPINNGPGWAGDDPSAPRNKWGGSMAPAPDRPRAPVPAPLGANGHARIDPDKEVVTPQTDLSGGKGQSDDGKKKHKRKKNDDRPQPTGWRAKLVLNSDDFPLSNFYNAHIALDEAPEMEGVFGFDEMLRLVVLLKPIPGTKAEDFKRRVLTDIDVNMVQRWLQAPTQEMSVITENRTLRAINAVAQTRSFHPIRKYLESLVWDRTARLDSWLTYYAGAESGAYTSKVGRWFLIGMAARIFKPGAQVDHMLILEGEQGVSKTSLCRILGGTEHFSESMPSNVTVKDSLIHLRGKWLIELGELHVLSKSDINELKKFLTKTIDQYRPPYGKAEVFQERQVSFTGTTNQREYFSDETGARRFWPVWCEAIDTDELRNDRDQLFAEAVAAYHAGERWWPDAEFQQHIASAEQDARYVPDAWEDIIADWLSRETGQRFTITEVACGALGLQLADRMKLGTGEQNRIRKVLTHLGWKRGARGGGSGARYYVRPTSVQPTDAPCVSDGNVRQFPIR